MIPYHLVPPVVGASGEGSIGEGDRPTLLDPVTGIVPSVMRAYRSGIAPSTDSPPVRRRLRAGVTQLICIDDVDFNVRISLLDRVYRDLSQLAVMFQDRALHVSITEHARRHGGGVDPGELDFATEDLKDVEEVLRYLMCIVGIVPPTEPHADIGDDMCNGLGGL